MHDATTLFAYLEALRPRQLLGPLEHLWQLGLTRKRSRLWPSLHLESLQPHHERIHLEGLAKLHMHVVVEGVYDLDWLQTFLHPRALRAVAAIDVSPPSKTTLAWLEFPSAADIAISLPDWFDQWSSVFHVTRVDCTAYASVDDLVDVLPRLRHLTSLVSPTTLHLLVAVLAFAAHSTTLTSLVLSPNELTSSDLVDDNDAAILVTTAAVVNATRWLATQPVREFRFHGWPWQHVARSVQEAFLVALFHHPTLEELDCIGLDLTAAAASVLPPPPTSLCVLDLSRSMFHTSWLTTILAMSPVHTLVCVGPTLRRDQLEPVLLALASTNVTTLALTRTGLADQLWQSIFALDALCLAPLVHLDLRGNHLTDDAAIRLADVLWRNRTLVSVDLRENAMGRRGATALVLAAAASQENRQAVLMLRLECNRLTLDDIASVEELATQYFVDAVFD
ncbi:Aste57867_8728 [Aphanomyces stellatus]|uniref:Aste57867_8728 protein n=1 Tax=Aphanomyces stellatus TaxID=120398 RepID=A0A485KLE9_9STRA|nr:hypothetical protein As57867_008694 [Aphanomyces stellatus]VFT85614.1 Aste57867_8728 [Aphanomyces stellatus]